MPGGQPNGVASRYTQDLGALGPGAEGDFPGIDCEPCAPCSLAKGGRIGGLDLRLAAPGSSRAGSHPLTSATLSYRATSSSRDPLTEVSYKWR
jgi:hypothetical protein